MIIVRKVWAANKANGRKVLHITLPNKTELKEGDFVYIQKVPEVDLGMLKDVGKR